MRSLICLIMLIGCTSDRNKNLGVKNSDSVIYEVYNSDSKVSDTSWVVSEYMDNLSPLDNYVLRVKTFSWSSEFTYVEYLYYCNTIDSIIPRFIGDIRISEGNRILSVEFRNTSDNLRLLSLPINKVDWSKIKLKNAIEIYYIYNHDIWSSTPLASKYDTVIQSKSSSEIRSIWNKYIKYFKICNLNK